MTWTRLPILCVPDVTTAGVCYLIN
jgi:hypothetical protein